MTAPLTALECDLLEVVSQRRDEAAIAVLGDYWIEHVDEARGAFVQLDIGGNADRIDLADEESRLAAHAERWREPLLRAGYPEIDLVLVDGFLQHPVSIPEGHPLDGHADIVRISPRYYRERATLRLGAECVVHEALAITPRTSTRVVIKSPAIWDACALLDHEFEVLRKLSHPNIVRTRGRAIRLDGQALVLEWAGTDLRTILAGAREHSILLGIDFAISVAVQLFDALHAIHSAGIVHKEIRSDHVALSTDGTLRVIDFGYAQHDGESPTPLRLRTISPGLPPDLGFRLQYMSPEQCRGRALAAPTDVFTAAGLVCELATNRHPALRQPVNSDFELLQRIATDELEAPPELPPQLRLTLDSCLQADATLRPSADAVRAMLVHAARASNLDIGPHVIARRLVELGVPA